MKIAHIAPPWLAIPPKNYGGTESMLSHLIEEQVAQGHDVTLFAPGDARTSAKLISFFPHSLIEAKVPWQGHLKAYYHLHQAVEYIKDHDFDIVHTHLSSSADMYLFPLMAHLAVPHVMTGVTGLFRRRESWRSPHLLFISHWTEIVQSRVATLPVVKTFNVLKDDKPRLLPGLKLLPIHAFAFERAEETLHGRVIVTVACATHAYDDA